MQTRSVFRWEREFTRSFLRLGIPIMIQSMIAALMHIVDNVMVGQLGEAALAGVTQANRVSFLYQLAVFGMVSGAAVFTAQYWGKRDVKGIRHVMGLGLMLSVSIAALFALPAITVPHKLLSLLIVDEGAQAAGAEYLRIIGVVYFVQGLSLLYSSILKSTEKVKLPMAASITAISLNTALNYLLIFGKFGFPKLGIRGAAIATLIGATAELVILISVSYAKKYATAARLRDLKIPSLDFVKRYIKIVLPVLLNEGFWSLGVVMYSAAYGRMGTGGTVVAAIGIYNNVEQLASVMLRGVTHAAAVMIGMCIGSDDNESAMLYAKRFLFGNIVVGLLAGVIVVFACDGILSWYQGSMTPQTLSTARNIILLYAASIWMKAACTQVIVGMMRPGGDVIFSALVDVLPLWLIGVPLVYIFGVIMQWPIEYVYPFTLIEETVKASIGVYRMFTRKWIRNLVKEYDKTRGKDGVTDAG